MADRPFVVPLTDFQGAILALLAENRGPDSYLAGGAALHFTPNSIRYSNDLEFFHDSVQRVATAFNSDLALLTASGYEVHVELSQPGVIRAVVRRNAGATRVDWAHDSAWRFMPPVRDRLGGFMLHEVDLAINKVLALAGRDEPRDYLDIVYVHQHILPLAALCWAAVGKDPGFTPLSLLELLKRRGRHSPSELARLHLAAPVDLVATKAAWLSALEEAEVFVRQRPDAELGCLYYSASTKGFAMPRPETDYSSQGLSLHFGSPGGVLPQVGDVE